jgi:hypothetical protein
MWLLVVLRHGYVTVVVFLLQIQYLCHNNPISIWQILIKFYYNESWHRIKVQIDFLNSIHFQTKGIKVPKRCFISCMYSVLFRPILMIFFCIQSTLSIVVTWGRLTKWPLYTGDLYMNGFDYSTKYSTLVVNKHF